MSVTVKTSAGVMQLHHQLGQTLFRMPLACQFLDLRSHELNGLGARLGGGDKPAVASDRAGIGLKSDVGRLVGGIWCQAGSG